MKQTMYKGLTITPEYDQDALSPRKWYNLGTLLLKHERFNFPDESGLDTTEVNSWEEMRNYICDNLDIAIIMPVYMIDHGDIHISTGKFNDRFDSGQIGFIYVTKETLFLEYGKILDDQVILKATQLLNAEIATYSSYVNGDVYGFTISNDMGHELEASWGYYGTDLEENGLMEAARALIDHIKANQMVIDEQYARLQPV